MAVDLNRLKIEDKGQRPAGGRWKTFLLCLLCLAIGFGGSFLLPRPRASGPARIKTVLVRPVAAAGGKQFTAGGWIEVSRPAHPIVISSRIEGELEQMLVIEGQMLKPGQVIARLYDKDYQGRLALATASYEAAKANLAKMQAGYRTEDIQVAEANVLGLAEKLRAAKASYDRSKRADLGLVTQEELDNAYAAYKKAEADHAVSLAELAKMRAGYRKEDVEIAKAEVENAGERMELARRELSYCTIAAPKDGPPLRVLKVIRHVGEQMSLKERPELVWLYDPAKMQARADVTQANLRFVAIGAEAIVTTEADPDRKYRGRVLRLEPLAELSKNTVTARVAIEDPDLMLCPEMVAQITFLPTGTPSSGPAGLVVPADALLEEGGTRYVFLREGGRLRRQRVMVSSLGGRLATVVEGLRSGQRVVVGDLTGLRDGQAIEEN